MEREEGIIDERECMRSTLLVKSSMNMFGDQ